MTSMNEYFSLQKQKVVEQLRVLLPSNYSFDISEDSSYHEGFPQAANIIGKFLSSGLMHPNSRLINVERLQELYELSQTGKACIIFLEHYSNLDYPLIYHLIRQALGDDVARRLIVLMGAKLPSKTGAIQFFTLPYRALTIFPQIGLSRLSPEKQALYKSKSKSVNFASFKTLLKLRFEKNVVVIFPAGTRYRPWDPSSKDGIAEIYSYLKLFDYAISVSINGNLLRPDPSDDMDKDTFCSDLVLCQIGQRFIPKEFIAAHETVEGDRDAKKRAVVKALMSDLEELHVETEKLRQSELSHLEIGQEWPPQSCR